MSSFKACQPIAVLPLAVDEVDNELTPIPIFLVPVVNASPASLPIAILSLAVLAAKAFLPIARLKEPVTTDTNALGPKAILLPPVVAAYSACLPKAVLY